MNPRQLKFALFIVVALSAALGLRAAKVRVHDAVTFRNAVAKAEPGTRIVLAADVMAAVTISRSCAGNRMRRS